MQPRLCNHPILKIKWTAEKAFEKLKYGLRIELKINAKDFKNEFHFEKFGVLNDKRRFLWFPICSHPFCCVKTREKRPKTGSMTISYKEAGRSLKVDQLMFYG